MFKTTTVGAEKKRKGNRYLIRNQSEVQTSKIPIQINIYYHKVLHIKNSLIAKLSKTKRNNRYQRKSLLNQVIKNQKKKNFLSKNPQIYQIRMPQKIFYANKALLLKRLYHLRKAEYKGRFYKNIKNDNITKELETFWMRLNRTFLENH